MIRNIKALGLAFVAVLAFGALLAPAAPAASFHSEASHTILDGAMPVAEDDVTTYNAGTWKCTSATYSGTTASATNESITVAPTWSGCTAFGFVSVPIDVNGCTYTFNANGSTTIDCPPGSAITTTAFNCHIKVGSQTFASGITYDNAGSGSSRDVTATAKISGLKYTQESKSFPGCTNGTFTNGTHVGSATFVGTNTTGGQVGIWQS